MKKRERYNRRMARHLNVRQPYPKAGEDAYSETSDADSVCDVGDDGWLMSVGGDDTLDDEEDEED